MGCKRIEKRLASVFQWYGELVGRRPFPFLVAPLILTLVVGPGLLTVKFDDDAMMMFTPYNAPSRREQIISRQFAHTAVSDRNATTDETTKFVLPIASDDSYIDTWFNLQVGAAENLMNQESWLLISKLVNHIYENFTCRVDDWIDVEETISNRKSPKASSSGPPYTLQYKRDFCNPKRGCVQVNTVVDRVCDLLNATKYGNNSKVRLTYPVMYVWVSSEWRLLFRTQSQQFRFILGPTIQLGPVPFWSQGRSCDQETRIGSPTRAIFSVPSQKRP